MVSEKAAAPLKRPASLTPPKEKKEGILEGGFPSLGHPFGDCS